LDPRLVARAFLAPAVVAAALALAGCDQDSIPTGRALAPLSDKMVAEIADKNMDKESPILVRLFKEEAELEVWKKNRDGQFALLKTYPICRWSGDLGPKKKEGDRQAPEGFYTISPAQMNPNSNYYLAFNTGYPNAYDRSWGYTGSELMVHGDCSSRGCYAMTDEQIQEIYGLARESFFGGQKDFQFEAFPFRMTALNMARHRNNPSFAFWKMIKEGYDHFEATRQEPKVAVCERHYVFDPASPDNASKPLKFDPRGKCPVYELDKTVADVVLDHRRQEQFEMAKFIADNVATASPHVGDGGMNPVFANKLASHAEFDNNGRSYMVPGNSEAPGALPHVPNPPGAFAALRPPKPAPLSATPAAAKPASEPTTLASVRLPQAAPLPKEGDAPAEQPTTIAGLLGNLFGGSQAVARPAEPEAENGPVALRGTDEGSANPQPAVVRTASAPRTPAMPRVKPQPASKPVAVAAAPTPQPAPKAVAVAAAARPAPKPRVAQAEKRETQDSAAAGEMRTAYSATPPSNNNLLTGAQPVLPAGTFDQRWSSFR
jgi:murein L,D-transpeptidase YafK